MKKISYISGMLIILLSTSLCADNKITQQFNELALQYETDYFDHYPELGLLFGKTAVAHDRFSNHSNDANLAWQQKENEYLANLQTLNVAALEGTPLLNTYRILKATLENNKAARVCKEELWNVNPTFGWHNVMTMVVTQQPVGTDHNRQMALKRWQTFGVVVNAEINNLQLGLAEGYSAPKAAVQRVLNQLTLLRTEHVEDSPFYDLAKRDGDPKFKTQVENLIKTVINPALNRYARYLEKEYLPLARTKIGVSALPSGEKCYQAKIVQQTTLNVTPEDIHQYGREHMQQLKKEVAAIGEKEFGITDITKVFQTAKNNPTYLFHTEEDILNYDMAALARAKAKIPRWFGHSPKAEGIIQPYPLHRAKTGAAGEYTSPSEDGTKPGIFYINTYEPDKRSRIDQEATLFHELIPGHHFQIALSYENKSQHSLDKYLYNSGYVEGWALYVERLADDMGLYLDDISRLGMLSNEAMRTARLVVDPGIHVMNWSRDDAVQYLKQHTALDENIIQGEVDRYIMMPGQATAYMLGKREIERLRLEARRQLGADFDIRYFHDAVLSNGSVTLPMLKTYVENWIKQHANNA